MLIGDKIRLLRKNKNITQTQLAEDLLVSPQSVSKWENHLSSPDISILPIIARYFGITMDELFGYRLDALNYKERFINFMVNNGILKFGSFLLKSGRISPYFIHSGYTLTGSQISKLGEFYADCIREHGTETNCIVGTNNRQIPLAIASSMVLFNKYGIDCYHCVDCDIESKALDLREITMVTDAFTSGDTLCSSLDYIKSTMGKYPSDVVVCVDRMEKTEDSAFSAKRQIEKEYNIRIHSIVNADDILAAVENGVISVGEYAEELKKYLEKYKGE